MRQVSPNLNSKIKNKTTGNPQNNYQQSPFFSHVDSKVFTYRLIHTLVRNNVILKQDLARFGLAVDHSIFPAREPLTDLLNQYTIFRDGKKSDLPGRRELKSADAIRVQVA